jgi:hypothetical protein
VYLQLTTAASLPAGANNYFVFFLVGFVLFVGLSEILKFERSNRIISDVCQCTILDISLVLKKIFKNFFGVILSHVALI